MVSDQWTVFRATHGGQRTEDSGQFLGRGEEAVAPAETEQEVCIYLLAYGSVVLISVAL